MSRAENGRPPEVSAVVLTWNATEIASNCVSSLLANDYPNLHVIVVDNGSETPAGEEIKARFPSVELVVLPENRGFTGGANAGLARCLEGDADYIFFLNNDTIVAENAISALVRELEARPRVGAATALLLFSEQEKPERTCHFYTASIHRDSALHEHFEIGTPMSSRQWPTASTDFAPACALMFRAEALAEIGLFDESLGTNWEDYDLCLRLIDANWPMITVGDAEVIHIGGVTTGRLSPYINYYYTRNRLICLFRHGSPLGILRSSVFTARTFWRHIRSYGFTNWPCHRSFVRAIFDFLVGVRGKGHPPTNRAG